MPSPTGRNAIRAWPIGLFWYVSRPWTGNTGFPGLASEQPTNEPQRLRGHRDKTTEETNDFILFLGFSAVSVFCLCVLCASVVRSFSIVIGRNHLAEPGGREAVQHPLV